MAGHRQKYLKRSHPPSQMFALGSILALCFAHHHHQHHHHQHHHHHRRRRRRHHRRRRHRRHRHRRRHHQQHYTDKDLQFEVFYTSKILSI